MPNLKFLHTRLNLDMPLDLEIYNALIKYPEGERSRVVRRALLAYIKGEGGRGGKLVRKSKTKNLEPNQGNEPTPKATPTTLLPAQAGETSDQDSVAENSQGPLPTNSEHTIKELLNLVR
jgi:hypothetical protein